MYRFPLTRGDVLILVAAVAHIHQNGLDRIARDDRDVRELIVGARAWQAAVAYPSRGEIPITVNGLIRTIERDGRAVIDLELPAQRLNIVFAALARFARLAREHDLDTQPETAAILDGTQFGLTRCPAPDRRRILALPGEMMRRHVGQAIAA